MRSSSVSSTAGQCFASRRATASMNAPSPAPISRIRLGAALHMLAQQPGHDRGLEHQRIDADEIAARMNRLRIVGRKSVEDFGLDAPQRNASRQRAHHAVRNIMVSVVNPGPNAMPQPMQAGRRLQHLGHHEHDGRRRHVAVLPQHVARYCQARSDQARAPARPRRAPSGRRDAPPTDRSRRPACRRGWPRCSLRSVSRIAPGTWPDSTMSKPSSRMCQLISSRRSAATMA